jgi:hypothetical protein
VNPARLLPVVRAGYGGALLVRRPGESGFGRPLLRVLGLRNLAQAAVSAAVPGPRVLRAGVGVDLLHAASMLTVAATSHRHRRAALTQAGAALGFAAAGASLLRPPGAGTEAAGTEGAGTEGAGTEGATG